MGETGGNTIASLRVMEKLGGKYTPRTREIPHKRRDAISLRPQNAHKKNTHASENRTQYNCVPTRYGKTARKVTFSPLVFSVKKI